MSWIDDLKNKYEMFAKIHPYNFGVGDGWRELVEQLCYDLKDFPIEVVQVKEKFGGLRFYIDTKSDEIYDKATKIIHEAEAKSFVICENCGMHGNLRNKHGWLTTLCSTCGRNYKECNFDLTDRRISE